MSRNFLAVVPSPSVRPAATFKTLRSWNDNVKIIATMYARDWNVAILVDRFLDERALANRRSLSEVLECWCLLSISSIALFCLKTFRHTREKDTITNKKYPPMNTEVAILNASSKAGLPRSHTSTHQLGKRPDKIGHVQVVRTRSLTYRVKYRF